MVKENYKRDWGDDDDDEEDVRTGAPKELE